MREGGFEIRSTLLKGVTMQGQSLSVFKLEKTHRPSIKLQLCAQPRRAAETCSWLTGVDSLEVGGGIF